MNNLNYLQELRSIKDSKKLVEVYFHGASSFIVCYILDANEDYITLGVINNTDSYIGVGIFLQAEVQSISVDTAYLKLLEKTLKDDFIYKKAVTDIQEFNEFTFQGFISSIEKSGILGELIFEDERVFAKIVSYNDDTLMVDEYSDNRKGAIAHTFYKLSDIVSIAVNTPSLKMVEIAQLD